MASRFFTFDDLSILATFRVWPQDKPVTAFLIKNKIQKSRGCAIFEFCFGLRNTGTLLLLVTTFLIRKKKIKGSFWADYGMNPC